MKYLSIVVLCLSLFSCQNSKTDDSTEGSIGTSDKSENMTSNFYVGTYTSDKPFDEGGSEGIYEYALDDRGKLTKNRLVAKSDNPSFITKSSDGRFLIAVNEIDSADGEGTVESYLMGEGELKKLSESGSGGAHPCFVATNSAGQVITANYTSGNVGLLNISKNGTLSELLDVQQHDGKGTTERQEAPHAHSAWFRPDGRGVISVDLGTNELWFSSISNNKFVPSSPNKLAMKNGAGPRHVAFHPNGKYIYVMNELDNTVGLLIIKGDEIVLGDVTSILPDGFAGESKAADIHVSPDGNYVYASNRGHNSIAIMKVDATTGILKLITTESVKGDGPRSFKISPNGKFLVVANQLSNNIVSFKRNKETGLLSFVSEVFAPTPVCILF